MLHVLWLIPFLPVLGFVVKEQRFDVARLVELAFRGVDADLAEQRVEAEGARLVGNDGHDIFANGLVPQQQREWFEGQDFSKDSKQCFSLDGVRPHDRRRRNRERHYRR